MPSGVYVRSEETKKRISESKKGCPAWNKGLPCPEETKKKLILSHLGQPSWCKGKKGIFSSETLKKMSLARKGRTPWNKGIPRTLEEKAKISASRTGKHYPKLSEACKKGYLEGRRVSHGFKKGNISWNKGKTGIYTTEQLESIKQKTKEAMNRPEVRKKVKEMWQNEDFLKKIFRNATIKPNKKETLLIEILRELNLPYKYTGDYSFWIKGKNPDFVNANGQKKIIELFGDYWHGEQKVKQKKEEHEERRVSHYAEFGYKTLIIWENELKDKGSLVEKISAFDKF